MEHIDRLKELWREAVGHFKLVTGKSKDESRDKLGEFGIVETLEGTCLGLVEIRMKTVL